MAADRGASCRGPSRQGRLIRQDSPKRRATNRRHGLRHRPGIKIRHFPTASTRKTLRLPQCGNRTIDGSELVGQVAPARLRSSMAHEHGSRGIMSSYTLAGILAQQIPDHLILDIALHFQANDNRCANSGPDGGTISSIVRPTNPAMRLSWSGPKQWRVPVGSRMAQSPDIGERLGSLWTWCRTTATCSREDAVSVDDRSLPGRHSSIGSRVDPICPLGSFALHILIGVKTAGDTDTVVMTVSERESHEACPGVRPLYRLLSG